MTMRREYKWNLLLLSLWELLLVSVRKQMKFQQHQSLVLLLPSIGEQVLDDCRRISLMTMNWRKLKKKSEHKYYL